MEGVIIPQNKYGEYLSPYEEATGVPLTIFQSENPKRKGKNSHHAFFLSETFKQGTAGDRATRFSRLQLGNKSLHSTYHSLVAGSLVPSSDADKFAQVIMGCAGYVPPYAVDVSKGSLDIVELTNEQREELRQPGVIHIESSRSHHAEIGKFLMDYAINQDFSHAKQGEIERFLAIRPRHIKTRPELQSVKARLGSRLIGKAIEAAVEPLNPLYQEAKKEKAIKVGGPVCAWWVVRDYLADYVSDYFTPLEKQLSVRYS